MEQTFTNALEAAEVMEEIHRELFSLPYNTDLHRLYHNLSLSCKKLSQLEVYVRRTHLRSRHAIEYKKEMSTLREGIKMLKYYMLMARLMA